MCVSEEQELLTLVLSFLFNKPRRRFKSNTKLEIDLVVSPNEKLSPNAVLLRFRRASAFSSTLLQSAPSVE